MRNATARALGGIAAGAFFLAAQTASAQQTNGCPAGQAMQSSDPSGRNITCVPIPNVSALQGQISAEAAARATADTQLQNAINAETAARMATDNAEAASRIGMDATLLHAINEEAAARNA